eukprot:gi/632971547/ref/XP_007902224.1/ PREDICTED: DNA polymerase iota isoform X2 [Callorhinchus milii]
MSWAPSSLEGSARHSRFWSHADSEETTMDSEEEGEREWLCSSLQFAAPETTAADGRVIVHIDLDCFYAQVEMIRNPKLRNKPIGVHQKYLMVTCNYEARKRGVSKLMLFNEAKEKCPELVMVNGEDLTPYREISYKVTELLEEFSPLVERLGFDENFIDATKLVEKRLGQIGGGRDPTEIYVSGHIYNNQALDTSDGKQVRLALGSQVAAEMRAALHNRLGLTGCAGIACNKLLAKMVSGTFKPNQQTTLLPDSTLQLMRSLTQPQQLIGIGYKTAKRLEALGVRTLSSLQTIPLHVLEKELGSSGAQRIQRLSLGEDKSPVTPKGPPQSFSDEDSFRKCTSEAEVRSKIEVLLTSLLNRLQRAGRTARTVRLTIRRIPTNRGFNYRESRQCPVPLQLRRKLSEGSHDAKSALVEILMKLFWRLVNAELGFHLTLISVCFSNLTQPVASASAPGSISFYLTQNTNPGGPAGRGGLVSKRKGTSLGDSTDLGDTNGNRLAFAPGTLGRSNKLVLSHRDLPPGIDPDVFKELPTELQMEILADAGGERAQRSKLGICRDLFTQPEQGEVSTHPTGPAESRSCSVQSAAQGEVAQVKKSQPTPSRTHTGSEDRDPLLCSVEVPSGVDPGIFSQLPPGLQKELLTGWRQQAAGPIARSGKGESGRGVKRGRRSSQDHGILKYFKPS